MRYILSVDPGKVSGISLLSWSGSEDELPEKHFSIEANDLLKQMMQFLLCWHIIRLVQ